MSITLQIILSAISIALLVTADLWLKKIQPAGQWLFVRISRYLLRKSYNAAMADARQLKAKGLKVYLLLWNGDWEAMPKQNFKTMWHSRPGMKKKTIQQWQKEMIEV